MAVTINGTTGVAGVDGSASTPAIQGADTNTGVFFPAADTVAVATGGSERMRVDSSGNVGIGVTPSAWDTANSVRAIQNPAGALWNYSNSNVYLSEGYYFNGSNRIYSASSIGVAEYSMQNGTHIWASAASGTAGGTVSLTERARIDSSGNLLVGTTSIPSGSTGGAAFIADNNSRKQLYLATTSSANQGLAFFINTNGTVGSISTSGSATTYSTSSDYRLKEDIAPMTGALSRVAALKPVTYKWKVDGSNGEGFIAHELAELVPQCVTGEKDAVDADGNPVYQGIDTSFLVATLTAAIQELKAELDALKAQVAGAQA